MAKKIDKTKVVKKLVTELLAKIGQAGKVVVETGDEDSLKVSIETEEPGVLIGFHAKTLSALQLILGLMIYQKLGGWQSLIVDVNGYREEQMERLRGIAQTTGQKVRLSGRSVALSPMTPFERRVVHLALSDFEGVETKSEGEGVRRYVVILPKK